MFSLQSEYISPYSVSTHFPILLWHFLYDQTHPDADIAADVHINDYQSIHSHIYVYLGEEGQCLAYTSPSGYNFNIDMNYMSI